MFNTLTTTFTNTIKKLKFTDTEATLKKVLEDDLQSVSKELEEITNV